MIIFLLNGSSICANSSKSMMLQIITENSSKLLADFPGFTTSCCKKNKKYICGCFPKRSLPFKLQEICVESAKDRAYRLIKDSISIV